MVKLVDVFFFQAEDGIRDVAVTGVQTCALRSFLLVRRRYLWLPLVFVVWANCHGGVLLGFVILAAGLGVRTLMAPRVWRSEERRVGKEGRCRWAEGELRKQGRSGENSSDSNAR